MHAYQATKKVIIHVQTSKAVRVPLVASYPNVDRSIAFSRMEDGGDGGPVGLYPKVDLSGEDAPLIGADDGK